MLVDIILSGQTATFSEVQSELRKLGISVSFKSLREVSRGNSQLFIKEFDRVSKSRRIGPHYINTNWSHVC